MKVVLITNKSNVTFIKYGARDDTICYKNFSPLCFDYVRKGSNINWVIAQLIFPFFHNNNKIMVEIIDSKDSLNLCLTLTKIKLDFHDLFFQMVRWGIMIGPILLLHDSLLRPLVFALNTIYCFIGCKNICISSLIDKTIELS